MARPGHQVNEGLAPSGSELAARNATCLADLGGVEAWSAGEPFGRGPPGHDRIERKCCPPQQVSTWNKVLWGARLELRHDVRKGLSLLSVSETLLPPTRPHVLRATTLVHVLLTTQRFLTALDIDTASLKGCEARISEALRSNPFIRFLKVNSEIALHKNICAAIATLANLEEVECLTTCMCPADFCAALAELLRTSTKLTALRIPNLHMSGAVAIVFLPALLPNSTLEELSFHSSAISEGRPEHCASFAKFLAGARTMKKLTVTAYLDVRPLSLKRILEGLLTNTTVTEVTLDGFVIDVESADLMTEVLASVTLRLLNVNELKYDAWMRRAGASTTSCKTDFSPWLFVLMRNETLRAVTLPFEVWEPVQWEDLFQSLSAKASPLKLTIRGHESSWEKLCGALQRSGIEEQVSFDTTLYILDGHEMIQCKAFSKFYSFPHQDEHGRVSRVFRRLPSFGHVTTAHLEIWVPGVDEDLRSDITSYISTTSALKELHLVIRLRQLFPEEANIGWAAILESLRQNASVNELRVVARSVTAPQIQLLADALNCSRNIRRVHIRIEEPDVAAVFLRRLRDGIERNYNILSVTVDCCLLSQSIVDKERSSIWDVTRRNSDFVARAALFANGIVADRYGAEALELVAEHPSLWQELAQQLSVSDAEAAALVRTTLKSIHSLDGFMRAAGVVKERVTCEGREDGRVQLDNLNDDCWHLVRRLLRVEDVKDPATRVVSEGLSSLRVAAAAWSMRNCARFRRLFVKSGELKAVCSRS